MMMLADLAIWPTGWTRLYNRGCVIFGIPEAAVA